MKIDNLSNVVILANGGYPSSRQALDILLNSDCVVCCDGAANRFIAEGHTPSIIIGDGDSISEENRIRYKDIIVIDSDQETNDQTKAVNYLINKGITEFSIVGATGKRDDHTLGNIALLAEYLNMGAKVYSYTDYGVFIPCRNQCEFKCVENAQVSIFNINARELRSEGLSYPIYDFTAWWQGTLNNCPSGSFKINAIGDYIVYITYDKK
jgi:thiamine pyrophosphokinase